MEPIPDLTEALELIKTDPPDLAILDINLSGEMVFPAAEELRRRGIPFVFQTGYSCEQMPPEFAPVPCLHKPFRALDLTRMLANTRD